MPKPAAQGSLGQSAALIRYLPFVPNFGMNGEATRSPRPTTAPMFRELALPTLGGRSPLSSR